MNDLKQQIEYALTREEVPTQEILRILRDMLELIENNNDKQSDYKRLCSKFDELDEVWSNLNNDAVTCCGIEITD